MLRVETEKINKWTETSWAMLRDISSHHEITKQNVECFHNFYQKYQNQEQLQIGIMGAYNSGKTTLLKRLLCEYNATIPDWATISGKRETFQVNTVPVGDKFVVTDTPGLCSGETSDDESALESMALADVYLWTLPPNLITSNKQGFIDFFSGKFFMTHKSISQSITIATIAAISRMDSAGIDPEDDNHGYDNLCERKIDELKRLFEQYGICSDFKQITCICADPYGEVGNSNESFDDSFDWDGINNLKSFLEGIYTNPDEKEYLRALGGARYTSFIIQKIYNKATHDKEELQQIKNGFQNEVDRHDLFQEQLTTLINQAYDELLFLLEDIFWSWNTQYGSSLSSEDMVTHLKQACEETVTKWNLKFSNEYENLVFDIECTVKERAKAPTARGISNFVQRVTILRDNFISSQDNDNDNNLLSSCETIHDFITQAYPQFKKGFSLYAEHKLGMTIQEATRRLTNVTNNSNNTSSSITINFCKNKGNTSSFQNKAHFQQANKMIIIDKTLDIIIPGVLELGAIGMNIYGEHLQKKEAEERSEKRKHLNEKIAQELKTLANDMIKNVQQNQCHDLSIWITETIKQYQDSIQKIETELNFILNCENQMKNILTNIPLS